ncbi:MAG: O-methyltransferase [Clostridiales bacterium]|nr:O-methyltransferase [Clostridiales bacterium]
MIESEIREFAKENFVPIVRPKTKELLIEKIKEINPKNILEIGTAIGYSGILMLLNSNANLITLEKNENMAELAIQNFEKENLLNRVNLVLGDAKNYIENTKEKFDFIFLDGPKGQYLNYLPYLLKILNKNGLLFCDNVLFEGLVRSDIIAPKKHRTIVNSLRKFLSVIENDNTLNVEVLDLEDGVALIEHK